MKFFGSKKNDSDSVIASDSANALDSANVSDSANKPESKAASKEKKHHNANRVSYGIGTAIVILLAFSCVVGADSFLTENAGTEGENYDMVTPDYYS